MVNTMKMVNSSHIYTQYLKEVIVAQNKQFGIVCLTDSLETALLIIKSCNKISND